MVRIYIIGAKQMNRRISVIDLRAVLVTCFKRPTDEETNHTRQDVGFVFWLLPSIMYL